MSPAIPSRRLLRFGLPVVAVLSMFLVHFAFVSIRERQEMSAVLTDMEQVGSELEQKLRRARKEQPFSPDFRHIGEFDTPGVRYLVLGGAISHGISAVSTKVIGNYEQKLFSTYAARLRQANPNNVVHNLSDQAWGPLYTSTCVQSMIKRNNANQLPDEPYDVIVLEYSMTGLTGLELLVHRLREAYPYAQIVYVHLYSRRTDQEDKLEVIEEIIGAVGGQVYVFPRPGDEEGTAENLKKWFSFDRQNLSKFGHLKIASEVQKLALAHPYVPRKQRTRQSNWHGGDTCYNWSDGETPLGVTFGPGGFLGLAHSNHGWYAYQVPKGKIGQITFRYNNDQPDSYDKEPVFVAYRASKYSFMYPSTVMKIRPSNDHAVVKPVAEWDFPEQILTSLVGTATSTNLHRLDIQPMGSSNRRIQVVAIMVCRVCREYGKSDDIELLHGPFAMVKGTPLF